MIIKTERDVICSYFEDHSGLQKGFAEAVYIPENEDDIKSVLSQASKNKTPITISGAGTGVTGARIPFGGIVLSLELMNKIVSVNKDSSLYGSITVQPSVRIAEIKAAASKIGLMYAPDPTESNATAGGTVATNASGARGYKYGATRKYVKRLRIILSSGQIFDLKRGVSFADNKGCFDVSLGVGELKFCIPDYKFPDIKNAAGYFSYPGMDLIDLFIGMEGTLGVITEIELELIKSIDKILSAVIFFDNEISSLRFSRIIKNSRELNTISIEYFDCNSLNLLKSDYASIPAYAKAAVFIELDMSVADESNITAVLLKSIEENNSNPQDVWLASTKKDQEGFREFRHRLPEKVNSIVKLNGFPKVGTDIAVPEKAFFEMYDCYKNSFEKSGLRYLIFGHIGENHFHANILPENIKQYDACKEIYKALVQKAVSLGGTVSAEHGIGKLKHVFLEIMFGKKAVMEMAALKKYFDPACILNRDNIFPKEYLYQN